MDYKAYNMANVLRMLSADIVEKAKSGHPGMPLGMADVVHVLFRDFLNFNPHDPLWLNRDRFVLSAGHGSALLYSLLYLTGYSQITLEELQNFRQAHSQTPGHPEHNPQAGIETTTGPLGQGVANAVGMALASKILQSRYGHAAIDHKVYAVCGDGCLMEGVTQEAISLAGHLKLNNLILLFDDNAITIDGATNMATSENHLLRFAAAGWQTQAIDGHKQEDIYTALQSAQHAIKPTFIACRTKIGFGAPTKQGTAAVHGAPLGATEISALRETLAWQHEPFKIPAEVLQHFRDFHKRVLLKYNEWQQNSVKLLADFLSVKHLEMALKKLSQAKQEINQDAKLATRKASENALNIIAPNLLGNLIGGSADLTSSNLTYVKAQKVLNAAAYDGSYIYYGVREHAMAAIMNGLSLHSNFIPYGGTFLCFSDYARPAMRLAALMRQRVIYVMTHDSIGLGEDGPTHQPVEHLAALRAIPHFYVFRPADEAETFEAWEMALLIEAPSVLALSRQAVLPIKGRDLSAQNHVARGAYLIGDGYENPQVTIYASGSEVSLAQQVKERMQEGAVRINIVSVPCMELFWQQDADYISSLLNNDSLKVVIEAGIAQPWGRFLGANGLFFGVEDFGLSAPYEEVYKHFALDVEHIVAAIKKVS